MSFEHSVRAVINMEGITPWDAKDMVKANLEEQLRLSRISPLRYVPVAEGVDMFSEHIGHIDHRLSQREFIRVSMLVLRSLNIEGVGGTADQTILEQVFQALDFDDDKMLTRGEWACGLSVFFKGTQAEAIKATFRLLDSD